jgi:DNA-binding FrmR family transcriptional regulator
MAEKQCPACSEKKTVRDEEEYKNLITRLNRIEGQVRGLKRMVEEERYCIEIIDQVASVTAALNAFNKVLLSAHIKNCVTEDIRKGNNQMADELCATLHRIMR